MYKSIMEKLKKYLVFGLIYCLFLSKSLLLLDPDLGWHLRLGDIYIHKGIQITDPLSYSMRSYPFVDHEWLMNILLYQGIHRVSFIGLALLFSLVTFLTLFLQIYRYQYKWYLLPFLLVGTTFVSFLGVRTQVVTWFFFSVLLWIVSDEKQYQKAGYFLPFLLLAWVNLHGGFAIGIAVLSIVLIVRAVQRKLHIKDVFLYTACVAVTFINPYGYRIWWEVWMQMSDSSLHWHIMEWFPSFTYASSFAIWLFFALSLVFVFHFRKKFSLLELVLYTLLLLLGLSSIRHMPFWLICALPLTTVSIEHLFREANLHPLSKKHFTIAYRVLLGIVLFVMIAELFYDYEQARSMSESIFYPQKAINYLHTHPTKGNIFSHYNYGGYLDWKLPQKRVFIDGRMPSWRWSAHNTHESNNAFAEWERIGEGNISFLTVAGKYGIDTVLWFPTKTSKKTLYDSLVVYIEHIFHIKQTDDTKFTDGLDKSGFHIVYQDDRAVIYRK